MSFFGLTALGPQNSFAKAERSSTHLHLFDDHDIIAAWNRVNGDQANACLTSKLDQVLKVLYRGPVGDYDRAKVERELQSFPDSITRGTFIEIMAHLREEAEIEIKISKEKEKPGREFTSGQEYQQYLVTHKPFKYSLQEKQSTPLTSSQQVTYVYIIIN